MRRIYKDLLAYGALVHDMVRSQRALRNLLKQDVRTTALTFTKRKDDVLVSIICVGHPSVNIRLPLRIFLQPKVRASLAAGLADSPDLPPDTDRTVMGMLYDDELAWIGTAAIDARLILWSHGGSSRGEA